MSFAMRFPLMRILGSLRTPIVRVQNVQNFQARMGLLLHLCKSENASCLYRCMASAASSGNEANDLAQKIESFGVTNYYQQYEQPWLKEICSAFLAVGVESEDLMYAFCQPMTTPDKYTDPHVFSMNVSKLQKLLNIFVNCEIEPRAIIRIVYHMGKDFKKLEPRKLEDRLLELASLPYMHTSLLSLLDVCPFLMYLDKKMHTRLRSLRAIFPSKELLHLLRNAPNVVVDPWEETREKLDYISKEVGLDQPHIAYNKTMAFTLQHIMERHQSMVRGGLYKKPNLQRDRLSYLKNEKLEFIMESSDEQFCKRVVRMPLEEYLFFTETLHEDQEEPDLTSEPLSFILDHFEVVLDAEGRRDSFGLKPKRSQYNKHLLPWQRHLVDHT